MITYLIIEEDASRSNLSVEDYTLSIWIWLLKKSNAKNMRSLARELNVYPKPSNVYSAILEQLFSGIAIN